MASQERITVYNLADLKNTSDDAIPNYLNSLKFKQSHYLTDVRLALGYSAFAIAAACFLWDYKFGFESTKWFTAAAVALYTALNGGLSLWIWAVEKGTIYVGTAPSGETVSISTSTKKNVPIYNVTVTITPKSGSKPQVIKLAKSFTEWFDSAGHFVAAPFQSVLANAIPAVGKLDPKRVNTASHNLTTADLELLAAAGGPAPAAQATGSEAAEKKGGKRRKA